MKCIRCGNVMIWEKFYGPQEHFMGWRCIYCGEVIDDLILENRQISSRLAQRKRRLEKDPAIQRFNEGGSYD